MKRLHIIITVALVCLVQAISANPIKTQAKIKGHILNNNGKHIPFASIIVEGTTLGTITDGSGHFNMTNLSEGTYILQAECLGYKPQRIEIEIEAGETKEITFKLEEDVLNMEEVVITGDRTGTPRTESSVIVNSLKPKLFENTQSITLSEGLNFSPGLRVENSCQNCGFPQVRMNGLEGPYSQILINSRPIFSGLAGVYGLEMIPAAMIERVEVIRGGGSALYGSNAIAGTINLILKDPINSSYEFGITGGSTGSGLENAGPYGSDFSANFNTSIVSDDNNTGMSLYGFYREKDPFDANGDNYSEITALDNLTLGTRVFHRFNARNKLTVDFFNIQEDRRGGDMQQESLLHMANIAEATDHTITTGAVTYDQFFRQQDVLSIYASGQRVKRESYYGAEQSLSDYGYTEDFSYTVGAQYNASLGESNLILGVEDKGAWLEDKKLGYPNLDEMNINYTDSTVNIPYLEDRMIADQSTNTLGVFAQYKFNIAKLNVSAGFRYDHYQVTDETKNDAAIKGDVFSPRLTLKYDIMESLQARMSYSQGYRAPQIYDEDLHIETSGARKVIHENSDDLRQETSHSYMASLDYNGQVGNMYLGLLVEGFYTQLKDAFVNSFGAPDENGVVVYTRMNSEGGAVIQGINMELNFVPAENVNVVSGFTMQKSHYKEAHEFGETAFFRAPDNYGYITLNWDAGERFSISSSGNYTGSMFLPYFGNTLADPELGELRTSDQFFDMGMKLSYDIPVNDSKVQVFGGIKNIFNSYQNDFDYGFDRDPGYIYGPVNPRTIYFGVKVGNML